MEKNISLNGVKIASAFFITACILLLIYLASDIITPLILASLLAILLRPAVWFLNEKLRFPSVIAVTLVVLLTFAGLIGLFVFLGYEISSFLDDLPSIKNHLEVHYQAAQKWIYQTFGYSYNEQKEIVEKSVSGQKFISLSSLSSLTGSLMYVVLIPIYTFLILIYRTLIVNFLLKIALNNGSVDMKKIILNIKSVVQNYIVGLLIDVLCISTMTGLGYYFIGLKYFIFLGILTGILNLIPYIGIIIACVISCLIALVTSEDLTLIVYVLIINAVVQFIDNNFIVPKVVGSKVSVNALASIVGVIIGGALAGIAGMFLAIPVLAILKVIFENSKGLEPYGYIIGDNTPKRINWKKLRRAYNKGSRSVNTSKNDLTEQEEDNSQNHENKTKDN